MNTLDGIDATYDHVAIAGPVLPDLLAVYRDLLGGQFSHGEVLPIGAVVTTLRFPAGQGASTGQGSPAGQGSPTGKVELMAPTPGSTFFDRFFASTGGRGGMHHLTFTVPDLAVAVETLHARGISTFGLSYDPEIWSEVFLHPRENGGVLIQLAQPGPGIAAAVCRDLDTLLAAAAPRHPTT